ncbi:MAG: quinolinate synthetase complex subunit A, quinolinate synthase [Candidatus Peregrinibacteria bacterium GW2011_GWF2_39_17]|nr:MAG: quinolinate synthetase complex subunit A, quinolinate synthase [Candidatus Peregrinibacteria bacterium GW2011_GWF2_39_17]HCW32304.1 quinolinate synthase [Candidatus Peregrinibacteria bacterium]
MQVNTETSQLIQEIKRLKKQKKAIVLAHNYQNPEIYEIADFIGDSLGLCQKAQTTKAKMIVFSGVYFMAESAAILNPNKKVVIPDLNAGCAMADMISVEQLKNVKKKYPKVPVVAYVNTTAEIKAEADICCTSANAIAIVKSLSSKKVIIIPDRNLAAYIASKVPGKEILSWDGYCPIHQRLTPEYIKQGRSQHPNAKIIAHPECPLSVIKAADYVCSTTQMIATCKTDPSSEFIILTECGMIKRLQRELPHKKFYSLCSLCFDMKKNTLQKIKEALIYEKHEIIIPEEIKQKALKSLTKMFEVLPAKSTRNKSATPHSSSFTILK